MSDPKHIVSEIFEFSPDHLPRGCLIGIDPGPNASALKNALSHAIRRIDWPGLSGEIGGLVSSMLDIDIKDVLVGAWDKFRSFKAQLAKHKISPGERVLIPLIEHTVHSGYQPKVEILMNEQVIQVIDFDIDLALTFKGACLKVEAGRIVEIRTGTCQGRCTVKCEAFVIFQKDSPTLQLPGSIRLGEGIPIGGFVPG